MFKGCVKQEDVRVHCAVPGTRPGITTPVRRVSFRRFGGYGEGETPGPIPNPEVKPFSADGTALETVWESRTPPDIHIDQESPPGATPAGFPAFRTHFRDNG